MRASGPTSVHTPGFGDPHSAVMRIVGRGEMNHMVRDYEWVSTSLGPIENWSGELVTVVNLVLSSPNPARLFWGEDLTLIYNDSYRTLLGRKHPEGLGKPAREVFRETWQRLGPVLETAFATGETLQFHKLLMPIDTGNGQQDFYFDCAYNPVYVNGRIAGLLGIFHDVTDTKRAKDALLGSEKLAAVGRLAASIAHEINNPLESVMNLLYLARHAPGPEGEKYLDLADEEIRRVSGIANQTLRFHKQSSKPQATSSADLFSAVMGIFEGRLRNARINVEKRFRTNDPVICFSGDIRQVLNNLVSNALEAMPFSGRLLARSRKGCDWKTGRPGLVLTVADNGAGIPEAAKKNIFEAFFTTKGAAGTGLGLWVCQEIVERHNGKLRVRSTQRKGRNGTTFTVFLPFEPESE